MASEEERMDWERFVLHGLVKSVRCYHAVFHIRKGATLTHICQASERASTEEEKECQALGDEQENPRFELRVQSLVQEEAFDGAAGEFAEEPGDRHRGIEEWMLPEGSHLRGEDSTSFFLNRSRVPGALFDDDSATKSESLVGDEYFLFGSSFSKTVKSANTERNARMEAIALVSPSPYVELCRPFMKTAIDLHMENGSESAAVDLWTVFQASWVLATMVSYSAIPLSADERWALRCQLRHLRMDRWDGSPYILAKTKKEIMEGCGSLLDVVLIPQNAKEQVLGCVEKILTRSGVRSVKIARYLEPSSGISQSLSLLFTLLSANELVALYFASLLERRVIVFGSKNIPADLLGRVSMAIAALTTSPGKKALCRTYPYASLHDAAVLRQNGAILSTSNPMFLSMQTETDLFVMCDSTEKTSSYNLTDILVVPADEMPAEGSISETFDRLSTNSLDHLLRSWIRLDRTSPKITEHQGSEDQEGSTALRSSVGQNVYACITSLKQHCCHDELQLRLVIEEINWRIASRVFVHQQLLEGLEQKKLSLNAFQPLEQNNEIKSRIPTIFEEVIDSESLVSGVAATETFRGLFYALPQVTQVADSLVKICIQSLIFPSFGMRQYQKDAFEIRQYLCLLAGLIPPGTVVPELGPAMWATIYNHIRKFVEGSSERSRWVLNSMLHVGLTHNSIGAGLIHEDKEVQRACRALLLEMDRVCEDDRLKTSSQLDEPFQSLLKDSPTT
eukprot:gb/GECG01003538.1/.p1 GENE.gb/GECG01003538.1/~~gb/GECG01003538.1/.p1  ORF type:complete len:735 (+),score=80.80 gb/GECG01003538.1/:1-2205(+)